MEYKEICKNQISTLENIITQLVNARDSFKDNTVEQGFFQNQISSISVIKNSLNLQINSAEIEELKKIGMEFNINQ